MAVNDKDVLDEERHTWKEVIFGLAQDTNDTTKVVIILHCAYCRRYYISYVYIHSVTAIVSIRHHLLSLSSGFSPSLPSLCNSTMFKGSSTRFCFFMPGQSVRFFGNSIRIIYIICFCHAREHDLFNSSQ